MSTIIGQQLVNAIQTRVDIDKSMSQGWLRDALKRQDWTRQDEECFQKVLDQGGRLDQMTMREFVFRYEEVLATLRSQLKDQNSLIAAIRLRIERFQHQVQNARNFPMVFLTIVGVTCDQPVTNLNLYYKIEPSQHPGQVLLQIRQQVVKVNRSYTLEVPDKTFSICFLSDNTNIGKWHFEGNDNNSGEVLTEDIRLEGLSVRVMVKYVNHVGKAEIDGLKESIKRHVTNISAIQQQLVEMDMFKRVFLPWRVQKPEPLNPKVYTCLNNHVKNFYYLLLIQILVECLGCLCTPVCFLSLLILFYLVLLIHDASEKDVKLDLGLCFLVLNCITIYTLLVLYLRVGINLRQVWWLYLGFSTGIVFKGMMLVMICNHKDFWGQAEQFMMNPA